MKQPYVMKSGWRVLRSMNEERLAPASQFDSTRNSSRLSKLYEIRATVGYHTRVPKISGISYEQMDLGRGTSGYGVYGKLGAENLDSISWKEPPHIVLANLPESEPMGALQERPGGAPLDSKGVEAFIRKYGILAHSTSDGEFAIAENADSAEPAEQTFSVTSEEMADVQNLLRRAWKQEPSALVDVQKAASVVVAVRLLTIEDGGRGTAGTVELVATNLWNFLCILFMRDYSAGKIGVCAHPGCPAPYFIKKRRTQKVCERGPCSEWVQRQYALRWWNEEGKTRRAKKVSITTKRTR
jgi:hypothetical protein